MYVYLCVGLLTCRGVAQRDERVSDKLLQRTWRNRGRRMVIHIYGRKERESRTLISPFESSPLAS